MFTHIFIFIFGGDVACPNRAKNLLHLPPDLSYVLSLSGSIVYHRDCVGVPVATFGGVLLFSFTVTSFQPGVNGDRDRPIESAAFASIVETVYH